MLQFVYDQDEAIAEVVKQITPDAGRDFGRCKTIGVVDEEGKLLAGFMYHHYDRKALIIEIGMVMLSRRACNQTVLKRILEYPFLECGCQMLIAHVQSDNESLLNQLARFNFDFTLIPRLYGRADDGVICTLTDDQWLDNKFSKWMYRDKIGNREAA